MKTNRIQFQAGMSLNQFLTKYGMNNNAKQPSKTPAGQWWICVDQELL